MNNKSFSLLELVAVISILVIFSVIATVRYLYSLSTLKFDAAAQKIAADIRYAQGLVIDRDPQSKKTGGDVGNCLVVDFSTSPSSYYIVPYKQTPGSYGGSGIDSPPTTYTPITDPFTKLPLTLNFSTSDEYRGVTITALAFGPNGTPTTAHAISFSDPAGGVNTGYWKCSTGDTSTVFTNGGTFPSAGGTITLSYGGKTKIIRISQTIGRVTIE